MNFRAFNGPVSLKRRIRNPEGCQGDDFRAFNGPVSLKLACGGLSSFVNGIFPGLQRPGLIEANLRRMDSGWMLRRFPGLQRPGLIEAGLRQ